jgi:hypothetical protein
VEVKSADDGDATGWNIPPVFLARCHAGGAEISNIFG